MKERKKYGLKAEELHSSARDKNIWGDSFLRKQKGPSLKNLIYSVFLAPT